ncbi:MAG: DsrE family protein [Deltaproteobacteria bacterium]|nr:DsrE family protein [Deltaproteobacteria bacterium]
MPKVAIVVLADTETHEGLGRVVNALEAAKEFKEANDDVRLIFDGAGTKWPGELARPEHRVHRLYAAVSDKIAGVCTFCAGAFGMTEAITACELPLLGDYEGHPSFRELVVQGYRVITF